MVEIMSAIDHGEGRVEVGSKKDVQRFFGYLDPQATMDKFSGDGRSLL